MNIQKIIFTIFFFIISFVFGIFVHGLLTLFLGFIFFYFLLHLNFLYSILLAGLISGTLNMIFNFRVFLEALIVEIEGSEGSFKYRDEIMKHQKEGEKYRTSVSIEVKGKKYRIIEFARYFFDPRAKNKDDLKGFLIFSEDDKEESVNPDTKREVLAIYLFWRHIYFDNVLGEHIKLKPASKKLFKYQLKFQKEFKKQIEKRIENKYSYASQLKGEEFSKILKDLDGEVYEQYPFVKEKLETEIKIFDSLYMLFTKPSDKIYGDLMQKIEKIGDLSRKENQAWNHRLTTWNNLVKHYDLKIEAMPNPNFKKTGISILKDVVQYYLTKQQPIISEETVESLIDESTKIPKKKLMKFLNNYFVLHKSGIDAIKLNIEVNKKFKDLLYFYRELLDNPPVEKIRN